jgi:hypothetical protein
MSLPLSCCLYLIILFCIFYHHFSFIMLQLFCLLSSCKLEKFLSTVLFYIF